MIVSYSHGFAFVHVHKTAGEALSSGLLPFTRPGDLVLIDTRSTLRHKRAVGRTVGLEKHSSAYEIRSYVGADEWARLYTFAFVRHPVMRAVSLYKYLGRVAEARRQAIVRALFYRTPLGRRFDPRFWPGMEAFERTGSFSEFIRDPNAARAPALRSQASYLCDEDGNLLVDFVGHQEHFRQDVGVLGERLALNISVPVTNNAPTNERGDIELSERDIVLLTEMFRPDWDLFGYDPRQLHP